MYAPIQIMSFANSMRSHALLDVGNHGAANDSGCRAMTDQAQGGDVYSTATDKFGLLKSGGVARSQLMLRAEHRPK